MKIDFYFDWFPGMNLAYAAAVVNPALVVTGSKRYKFTVEIDDPNGVTESPQNVRAEEVKS